MARTIRTIEAVASSSGMEVDRKAGIIHGVKILGLVSDNNRKYMPEAVRKAKSLYEGIKVNIDHPAESGDVRSAEDRFGKLINVEYVEGEGLYGDLMFLKSHPMAERICEAAERNDMNDTFGLSHNAQGDGQEDDEGCFVVSSIVEVRHVDLVADPATTKSLREARTRMKAMKEADSSDTFVCKIYKDFGGPYGKTGPKTIKEQSVSGSKEKAIAWVKSQLKSTPIKDDEQGKDYTIFGVVLRKGSGAIVAKYEKSETGSSIITHAESKGASMKAKESKQKPYASLYKGMWTVQDSNGKDIYSIPNKQYAIKFLNDNWDKLSSGTMQPHSSVKTKESDMRDDEDKEMTEAGNQSDRFKSAIARKFSGQHVKKDVLMKYVNDGKIEAEDDITPRRGAVLRDLKTKERFSVFVEAENIDDEDEMMTEAEDMPVEDPSEEEEMTEAADLGPLKRLMPIIDKAMNELEQFEKQMSGPGSQTKIGNTSSRNLQIAGEKLWDARSLINSIKNIEESKCEGMSDDEDEMMTEAEDMPVEDPSEEEMTESSGTNDMELSIRKQLENAVREAKSAWNAIRVLYMRPEVGPLSKRALGNHANELDDILTLLTRNKRKFDAFGNKDFSEAEGDPEDDMPMDEADDMSIDDITDKPAVEAYGEEDDTPMDEADDEEKMAMEGSSDSVGKNSREWDAHFEKQSPKMQSAINVGLHRGLSYPDAAKRAKSLVKEAIGDEEKDEMTMESKQYRKLQQFCKKNNMVLTRDLYKDLRPLSESAQQRCILRIKLASKARKPRSSGSMMPMTESKVHTGDNVFNWLRS